VIRTWSLTVHTGIKRERRCAPVRVRRLWDCGSSVRRCRVVIAHHRRWLAIVHVTAPDITRHILVQVFKLLTFKRRYQMCPCRWSMHRERVSSGSHRHPHSDILPETTVTTTVTVAAIPDSLSVQDKCGESKCWTQWLPVMEDSVLILSTFNEQSIFRVYNLRRLGACSVDVHLSLFLSNLAIAACCPEVIITILHTSAYYLEQQAVCWSAMV